MSLPADPLLIADDASLIQAPGDDPGRPGRRRPRPPSARPAPAAAQPGGDGVAGRAGAAVRRGLPGPDVYEAITGWSYSDQDFTAFLQPPSAEHWFGTTQIGGDVFAQTMRGLQKSLLIGLLVAVISTGLAAVVGAFAGYFGGWVDRVLMWIVDLLLVHPVVPDHRDHQPATCRARAG